MNVKITGIFALLVFGLAPVRGEPIKVFLLAGQSNMVGHGQTADLSDADRAPLPTVPFACRIVTGKGATTSPVGDGWSTLRPGPRTFGPEVGFGHALAGKHVAIIKYGRSGANLFEMFHPDATSGLQLYPKMIAFAREEIRALREKGEDAQLAGFIWYQGEADAAASEEQAKAFGENLKLLISRVRQDLEAPEVPVVAVRVNPHAERHVHTEVVRSAIEHVTESDGHAAWVNIDDLNLPDHLHLDAAGQIEAGKRLAAAWEKIATKKH